MEGNGKPENDSPKTVLTTADPRELLATALKYRGRGWRIMPLKRGEGDRIKHPAIDGWSRNCVLRSEIRLGLEETIRRWWAGEYAGANIGICAGPDSGIVVLDLDGPEAEAIIAGFPILMGPQVQTGKGRHLYFSYPTDGSNIPSINGLRPKIDVKASGGYLVAPPSIHPSGRQYAWVEGTEYLPLPEIPAWLMGWISEHTSRTRSSENPVLRQTGTDENDLIPEGQRNDTLFRLACSLRRTGLSDVEIEVALQSMNERRCNPPLSLNEIQTLARQAARYKAGALPNLRALNTAAIADDADGEALGREPFSFGYAWNDSGNAQRLIDAYGSEIRHSPIWDAWLVWDGRRWERGARYQLVRFAGDVIARFRLWAESLPDDGAENEPIMIGTGGVVEPAIGGKREEVSKKAALAFAKACGGKRKIADMIALAEAGEGVPVKPDIFDRDKYLLNCVNGTLDLRTGMLRPHSRTDYITKAISTEYHPDAKAPLWEGFLHRIMGVMKSLSPSFAGPLDTL